jgi:RNA ligase (TIGR02306 family)
LITPIFDETVDAFKSAFNRLPQDGDDVTDLLGVVKWDPPLPACLQGLARGNFPNFIQRTDQDRVQNCWEKVKHHDHLFEVTIKLDGSSMSVYHNNGGVGVCSRNLDLKLGGNDNNTFIQVTNRLGLLDGLRSLGYNIAIQGELMGPGIQGNREQLTQAELFVFDVYLIDERRHATSDERADILDRLSVLGVDLLHAPIIDKVYLNTFADVHQVLQYAEGRSINHRTREGVVFKSMELVGENVVSFKAIADSFLLAETE